MCREPWRGPAFSRIRPGKESVPGIPVPFQPVSLKFEGISYQAAIQDLSLFPQVCSAIAVHPELIRGEPSVLLMDIGGWTVGLMRLDNGIPNASACRGLELPHFLSCQSPLF